MAESKYSKLSEEQKQAHRARSREWKRVNREKYNAYQREYLKANPDKALEFSRRAQAKREAHPDFAAKELARGRARQGIKDATSEIRDGECALMCGYRGRLVPDHDHATGELRGWLCTACNLALGGFKDNPEVLETAASYLRGRDIGQFT